MRSTKPPAKELQEFFKIPLNSPEGPSLTENLYVRQGLVPSLSELRKKHESQLKEILKPRPFVRPLIRRKPRHAVSRTQPNLSLSIDPDGSCQGGGNHNGSMATMEAARCLPTPPYEPDQAPSPFMQAPSLYEDLDGIADVVQKSPDVVQKSPDVVQRSPFPDAQPDDSPCTTSLSAEHAKADDVQKSPFPDAKPEDLPCTSPLSAQKSTYTARKRTTLTCQPDPYSLFGVMPCVVVLEDLKQIDPRQRERLLKIYYKSSCKNTKATKRKSRRSSTERGSTTETENRLLPPLKIRLQGPNPTVQEVQNPRIATYPSLATVEQNSTIVQPAQCESTTAVQARGAIATPSCDSIEKDEPPSKRFALLLQCATSSSIKQTNPTDASPDRIHKPEDSPSTNMLHGLRDGQISPRKLPQTIRSPEANQTTIKEPDPSECSDFLDGLLASMSVPPCLTKMTKSPATSTSTESQNGTKKATLKGILKTRYIHSKKPRRVRFLSNIDDTGTGHGQLISLPADVIPSCELNVKKKLVVSLSLNSLKWCQKEVNLKTFASYPVVCVQCNITFPSRTDLSNHELVTHSSVSNF